MKKLVFGLLVLLMSVGMFAGTGIAKQENPEDLKRLEKAVKLFEHEIKRLGIQYDNVKIFFEPSAGVYMVAVENTPHGFTLPQNVTQELLEKTGYAFEETNYYEPRKTQYYYPLDTTRKGRQ